MAAAFLPTAAIGATWTEPVRLSGSPSNAGDPTLAFSPDGRPFATWAERTGGLSHDPGQLAATPLAVRGASGWSTGALPSGVLPLLVSVDARGELLAVGREFVSEGANEFPPRRITAWTSRSPAGEGAPVVRDRQIISRGHTTWFDGAATPRGDAAIAWTGTRGTAAKARLSVYAGTRRAGQRFTRPIRLSSEPLPRGRFPGAPVAIDPSGGAAVAWRDRSGIYVKVLRPGGRAGPRLEVGRARGDGNAFGVAIGPRGGLTVLWTRRSGDQVVIVAGYSRDGKRFGKPRVLDTCLPPNGCPFLESASGPNGELLTAWANTDGADPVVRAVSLRAGSGEVREIDRGTMATNDKVRVAADGKGNASVSWAAPYEEPTAGFRVALRPPGGDFGPTEFVPAAGQTWPGPAIAFDPVSGTPAAVFTSGLTGVDDSPAWFTERR